MNEITLTLEQYDRLKEKAYERDIIIALLERDFNRSDNTCYRNNIDILETFDENLENM